MYSLDGDTPGLKEEDMHASIATLKSIAETLDYEIAQLRERHEKDGLVTEFLLRKKLDLQDFMEIRFVIKSPKMFRKSLNSKN